MQTLLSTKLNIPPTRQELVFRSDLMALLAKARTFSLTLVSAPPGYGKTTLVSSWLRNVDFPYTWLSLDEGDNDPIRFLEYFLTALHTVVPTIRLDLLDLRQGSQAASFETLMALLINEATGAGDFFMVLDDFQALHTASILDMLGYLLEHLPPEMHMVLISRSDPPLALPRLRARGQLLEIRAEQLRFSMTEIAQFYDEVMCLPLTASDISAIETRTEGWIAGLQLAGLAMQAEKVPQRFISAFTGSQVYIMDYLTEEVLRVQPEPVRSFLLQTSILDRMCGSLCETVVRSETAEPIKCQSMLEAIERNHLFVIPLDTERRWYRYHHLFREVLSRRLEVSYPGQIPALHRRASEWFEQHGFVHEAIHHATKAGDADRTARLVEQHGCALLMGGELVTLANWLTAIDPYTHTRPWLAMQKAWVLALSGQAERADLAINEGEQLIAMLELTDEVRTLRGSFTAARALWANSQGKTDLAASHAKHAIDLLSVGGDFSCALRSVATSLLGDASWAEGKLDEARSAYAEAVQIGQIAGNPHMTMMSMSNLADIYFEQGKFHEAARRYTETLQMAEQLDGPNSAYAPGAYFGLGKVFYAWNRLDDAAASVEKSRQLTLRWENGNLRAACLALTAQLDLARGSLEKAQSTAAAVEELIQDHPLSPYWAMWISTALARFWLEQGKLDKALFLIRGSGVFPSNTRPESLLLTSIPLDDPVPFRLIPVYMVLARLFLATGHAAEGLTISECLLKEATSWGWGKAVTELLILKALAFQAKKDSASSLVALEQAFALAWSEQSKREFLDEGELMGKLLYQAKARGIGGEFVAELLSLLDQQAVALRSDHHATQKNHGKTDTRPGQDLLIEPLSDRELEVLRCIADGCSNLEIANQFVLSPLTVKRHISNIYAKLEAKNRTQAVSLARTLKLID
jgi:LuxR family transcriptional regulator, maltose regulon positive regulatory protein